MTPEDYAKIQSISQMLNEAYEHYFSYEGHCKSYEGTIQIDYGNFWERNEDPSNLTIKGVHISSYVFCSQGRHEHFDSVDEALEAVTKWHKDEMAYDPNTPEEIENREEMDKLAYEFVTNMNQSGRLQIIEVFGDGESENA